MGRVSDAKERLINAAMQLIWVRSYSAVGVNELCRQAGVKPGSFYYFFPSKQALVLAALEKNWKLTQANVMEPAFNPKILPAARISKMFKLVYQQQVRRQEQSGRVLGCAFGSLGSELGHQDSVVQQKVEEIFGRFCTYFEQTLQDAVDANLLTVNNIHARARAILAYLEGVLLLARTHNNLEIILQLTPIAIQVAGFDPSQTSQIPNTEN